MKLLPLSVTIISKNEATRIADAIRSVKSFAAEVIVVDSDSTDNTVQIAEELGAKVYRRPFAGFGQQKNYAQSMCTQDWVLNIDADERVSPELAEEIKVRLTQAQSGGVSGYFLPRKTWYLNRWVMHSGWYPNYLVRLARKSVAVWTEPEIHEALRVKEGIVGYFKNPLEHYSFPTQKSHILKNLEYGDRAMKQLHQKKTSARVWDLWFRPLWKFFDIYFIKMGFLDGSAGFFIGIHSAYALFLRYAFLYEQNAQDSRNRQ